MKQIEITHLYPKEMNIYGDNGNILVLQKRLEWLGYKVKISTAGVNEKIPPSTNIIIGGGGQDAGQNEIAKDLVNQKKQTLVQMANNGVVMLMICGLYQLFGQYFKTNKNLIIPGIGVLDVFTVASQERLIGNVIVNSNKFGKIIGYENHSGRTIMYKETNVLPLGFVPKGQGNNGEDGFEGCVKHNVIGSYLHGPVLSKNNKLTNHIIEQATGSPPVDNAKELIFVDKLVQNARTVAKKLER